MPGIRAAIGNIAPIGLGIALALFALLATAAGPDAVRKRAESSTLVTGTIDIERDGRVGAHRIDHPEKLHPEVVKLIAKAAPGWRFEPVLIDGQPVRARAKMSVCVILREKDADTFQLRIGSASFGEDSVKGETLATVDLKPPSYPTSAYMAGVQGTVYLALKIDRQGQVADVVDEQVNLTAVGNDQQMDRGRKLLARAARVAAKKWRFEVPVRGPLAGRDYWSIRMPVSFALCDSRSECRDSMQAEYGRWETYIPGPRNPVPWITDESERAGSDAMVAGEVYPVGAGPKLLTPLTQG